MNGLSCTFASDTPMMLLESVEGVSCGSSAITYKPIDYDGQLLISTSLNARNIPLVLNFGGKKGNMWSRSNAMERWQEIQKVFIPGQTGTLAWTDGTNSRFIRCRVDSTTQPTQILPFLFRVKMNLIADRPMWYDSVENVVELPSGEWTATINNDSGIAVPFLLEVGTSTSVFAMASVAAGVGLSLQNATGEGFTVDTDKCTVTTDSGLLVNNMLSVESEFFKLMPGENVLNFAGGGDIVIKWRKAYMGVF